MKRLITLSLALLAAMPFYAQIEAESYSVKESYSYTEGSPKPDDPSSICYNLFDANGNLVMELTTSTVVNTYDSKGLKIKSQTYSTESSSGKYTVGSSTEYSYDDKNQLVKKTSYNSTGVVTGYVLYENYVNGLYQDMKSMSSDGVTVTYWRSSDHVFEDGVLVYTVNSYRPSADMKTRLDSVVYIYNNGICTGINQYQFNSITGQYEVEPVTTETYTYAGDKLSTIRSVATSRWGVYVTEEDYQYSSLSADYVPQNLTVKEKNDVKNVLDISWSAPKNSVTGYRVIIDGVMQDEVSETAFVSDTLVNGMHMVAVAAVANGEIKNITDPITTTLNDEGVKPVTNLVVNEIKPIDGTSYPVLLSWSRPETTSDITEYRVYYSSYNFISVAADQTTVELLLPQWMCEVAGDDGIEGADVTVWVVTMYKTGMSEISNEVIVNPFNGTWTASVAAADAMVSAVVAYPNPVSNVLYFSAPVSVTIYNISGAIIATYPTTTSVTVNTLPAGNYLVKTIDDSGNATTQMVIVK